MSLGKEYKILVVDDAKDTQMLLEFDLGSAGYITLCCDSGEDALLLLKTEAVDLILLDMYMPGLTGLQTLEKLKSDKLTADIPVIMLSASTDEDEVVATLELGAGDYVTKPYVAKVLFARIRTAIRLQEKTTQLEYLAKTDFLTGINNRGSFFERSTNAVKLASRTGQSIVLAMFDIDFFKAINDNYGHDAGDVVLKAFSQGLIQVFRTYDILGRVGGEEFAVCLPNTSKETATVACQRFRYYIENMTVAVKGKDNEVIEINITVSIGLVLAENDLNIDELLKQADTALYYAKEHGRNQVIDVSCVEKSDINLDEDIHDHISFPGNNEMNPEVNNTNPLVFEGIDCDIGVNNVLGDEALFKEILVMFYQDHNQDANKIAQAINDNDLAALKHLAHTLKGVASSVGAMNLFQVSKSLDIAVNESNVEEIATLLTTLTPELNLVMNSIESTLDVS